METLGPKEKKYLFILAAILVIGLIIFFVDGATAGFLTFIGLR